MECRLCGSPDKLIDTFDPRFSNGPSLRSYINLGTGVEIKKDDVVSKLVCPTCMKMTFNMYLFRVKATKNDTKLKEQAGISNKENENNNNKPKNKAAINLDELQLEFNSQTFGTENVECEAVEKHETIKMLLNQYPNLVLPEEIFCLNILPDLKLDRCDDKKNLMLVDRKLVTRKRKLSVESSDDEIIARKIIRPGPASSKIVSEDDEEEIDGGKQLTSTISEGGKRFNTYICDYCSEIFTNKKKLKSHIAQHRREQTAVMKEISDFDDSFIVVSKTNDVFVCDVCNELFTTKKRLSYHSKEHNPCKFCNEKFMTAASLEDHTKQCREAIISKKFTLELTRCDDIPEIRALYASAFEDEEEEEEEEEVNVETPIVEVEDDDLVMLTEPEDILEPPIITNEFDYIKSIFEKEKRACGNNILKKVLDRPSCKSTNNSITFYGLHNDIMKQIKIPVVLKPRTDSDSIEGKIVQPPLPVVNMRTFDFSDIEPIVILAANKFKTIQPNKPAPNNKIRINPLPEPKKLQPKFVSVVQHDPNLQTYTIPNQDMMKSRPPLNTQVLGLRRIVKPNNTNGGVVQQLRVCNNQGVMHNGQLFNGPLRITGANPAQIAYPGQSNGLIKLVISSPNQVISSPNQVISSPNQMISSPNHMTAVPPPTVLNSTFRAPIFPNPPMMPLITQPPVASHVMVKPENMLKLRIKEPWEINNS